MPKNLVIVESPAKAKTIEGYLGNEFLVESSYGHIRDLPKDNEAIDIDNGFQPRYEIPADKKEIIRKLKKEADKSETIFLATDDDREGEAISWHLKEALNLDDTKIRRIVFHEITKNAILNAIQSPRGINLDLVNAQQARRVLDRLVGFELSPVLWKKIKTGLSAGRVQSVAVRLVVEREREIDKFKSEFFYKVTGFFKSSKGKSFKADLSVKFKSREEAHAFLEACIKAEFIIEKLEKKPSKKSPSPPFTTSTLQQEASRKLGFSVSQTMLVAQKLYESGKISYMRTDSVNLSQEALNSARSEIISQYGEPYARTRQYKTKSESAQEAHEAIRPTNFAAKKTDGERNEQRLYELIWKRAIASQMSEAEIEKTLVTIGISSQPQKFIATGEVIKFDGFLKVYIESTDEEQEENGDGHLPPLAIGEKLGMEYITGKQSFTRPPARYTEASLVKKLEELGIGRPSTYAPTISTILKRNYVTKETLDGKERTVTEMVLKDAVVTESSRKEIFGADKNKLSPTNTGIVVNDFLIEYFAKFFEYSFTADIEKHFDDISQGKMEWNKMIGDFYREFHPMVEDTGKLSRSTASSVRELGVDPVSGEKVYARLARFGPIVQLGESNGDTKPRFASLRKGQFLDNLSLEDGLALFKLPRDVGQYHGKKIIAGEGRFGPYLKFENKFISIKGEDDPLHITEQRAIELIDLKFKSDSEKIIKEFAEDDSLKILNGRWGPYVKHGRKNIKIPKDKDPASLSLEECIKLSENAPAKKSRFRRTR
ncbi:MAG TPA: type I DNA topoisomerase [Cyclobacteriaceae bacterium]|nr:type I DNA topoisomerase [Cyclobacteriaceae bacterium]